MLEEIPDSTPGPRTLWIAAPSTMRLNDIGDVELEEDDSVADTSADQTDDEPSDQDVPNDPSEAEPRHFTGKHIVWVGAIVAWAVALLAAWVRAHPG